MSGMLIAQTANPKEPSDVRRRSGAENRMKPGEIMMLMAVAFVVATGQLISTHGGLALTLVAGFAAGILVELGTRLFGFSFDEQKFLPAVVAGAASLVGLIIFIAGSEGHLEPASWTAPFLATLVPGVIALAEILRAARCRLCRRSVRRILSFVCPRCHLLICEYCWGFESCRCRLCEENHIALFPQQPEWWVEHLGPQIHVGKCSLCLRTGSTQITLRACPQCRHTQCQQCWDDNNGRCSRCARVMSGLPSEVMDHVTFGEAARTDRSGGHAGARFTTGSR